MCFPCKSAVLLADKEARPLGMLQHWNEVLRRLKVGQVGACMGLQCRNSCPRERHLEDLAISAGKTRCAAAHPKLRIEASSLTGGNAHEVWKANPLLGPEQRRTGKDPYLELNATRPLRKVDEMEQVIAHLPMESAATPAASRKTPGCHDRLNDAAHGFVELMLKHSCPDFVGFRSACQLGYSLLPLGGPVVSTRRTTGYGRLQPGATGSTRPNAHQADPSA